MNNMQQILLAWLKNLPHIKDVQPVTVTLGTHTFYGAQCTVVAQYAWSMRCVQEGTHKEGESYETVHLELVGRVPKFKKANVCFPYNGNEWFVSCYYDGSEMNHFHPCGPQFSIREWNIPGEKIDKYELHPYLRVPMTVTYETQANQKEPPTTPKTTDAG